LVDQGHTTLLKAKVNLGDIHLISNLVKKAHNLLMRLCGFWRKVEISNKILSSTVESWARRI